MPLMRRKHLPVKRCSGVPKAPYRSLSPELRRNPARGGGGGFPSHAGPDWFSYLLKRLPPLVFGIGKLPRAHELTKFILRYMYKISNPVNPPFQIRFYKCFYYIFLFSFFLANIQISFWAQITQASYIAFIFQISNIKLT